MRLLAGTLILFASIASSSCANNEVEQVVAEADETSVSMAANPAAVHCIDEGYELAEARFGDTTELMCVNAESGKKCSAWKYFREECDLEG